MTDRPRIYTGTEDYDDMFEARETRARLGAHHDEGTGAPQPISGAASRTASQVKVGDRITIGRTVYTVDKVTTDNGHTVGGRGYVNLELLREVDGQTKRTYQRHPWYQVLQFTTPEASR